MVALRLLRPLLAALPLSGCMFTLGGERSTEEVAAKNREYGTYEMGMTAADIVPIADLSPAHYANLRAKSDAQYVVWDRRRGIQADHTGAFSAAPNDSCTFCTRKAVRLRVIDGVPMIVADRPWRKTNGIIFKGGRYMALTRWVAMSADSNVLMIAINTNHRSRDNSYQTTDVHNIDLASILGDARDQYEFTFAPGGSGGTSAYVVAHNPDGSINLALPAYVFRVGAMQMASVRVLKVRWTQ